MYTHSGKDRVHLRLFDDIRGDDGLEVERKVFDIEQIDVAIVQANQQIEVISQQADSLRVLENGRVVVIRRADAIDAHCRI